MSFSIDGIVWPAECRIQRTAELTASDISGLLLDKSYFNDCLGTWMKYDVTMFLPMRMTALYSQIYEILTDPVAGHTFVLPYNQGTIEITGRVVSITDLYRPGPNGLKYWEGTSFTVIANQPSKTYTLGQLIETGQAAPPGGDSP